MGAVLYTIGHSTHPLAVFVEHLRHHGVTVLVDVRSIPRSRFVPHFNRDALQRSLTQAGISYRFCGKELGARSDNPACHRDGKARYELIAADPVFQDALESLRATAALQATCLMCAEQDPLVCHRAMLVGVRLRSPALLLTHILGKGTLEPHERTEIRLLQRYRLDHPELLRSAEERLAEAYRRHSDALAYRLKGT